MSNTIKALTEAQLADREHAAEVMSRMKTKSATIRYLATEWLNAKGEPDRGRISKGMDIIYQHVRNVLVQPVKKEVTPSTESK